MRKIIILFIAFVIPVISFAQQENKIVDSRKFITLDNSIFDCIYEYKIEGTTKKGDKFSETYNTILQVGNEVAKFWDYTAFAYDSVAYIVKDAPQEITKDYKNQMMRQVNFFETVIIQNYPNDKITVQEVIAPDFFTYTEEKDVMEWQLHQDTLTVAGNLCNKATTTFGGKDWTVWYSPAIPSSYGPWKFANLPGLILQAEDLEGVHKFTAIAIRQNSLPIYTDKSIQRNKTSKQKFIKNKIEYEKDPMNNIPAESIRNMAVIKIENSDKPTILVNGVQIRAKLNGYTALEL